MPEAQVGQGADHSVIRLVFERPDGRAAREQLGRVIDGMRPRFRPRCRAADRPAERGPEILRVVWVRGHANAASSRRAAAWRTDLTSRAPTVEKGQSEIKEWWTKDIDFDIVVAYAGLVTRFRRCQALLEFLGQGGRRRVAMRPLHRSYPTAVAVLMLLQLNVVAVSGNPPIADAQLREELRFRRDFGFDTEPSAVAALMANPANYIGDYGVALTPAELADLRARLLSEDHMIPVREYAERQPTFAGA